MTITAPDLHSEQGGPDNGSSLSADPWTDEWAPPTPSDVTGRHASARRRQQERHRSYGFDRVHVGGKTPRPRRDRHRRSAGTGEKKDSGSQRSQRQRRLRAIRIAVAVASSGLVLAALTAGYWYTTLTGG